MQFIAKLTYDSIKELWRKLKIKLGWIDCVLVSDNDEVFLGIIYENVLSGETDSIEAKARMKF